MVPGFLSANLEIESALKYMNNLENVIERNSYD